MLYAPFTFEQKQLRRDALAELEEIEDRRDEWARRPLGGYTPSDERRFENRLTRRKRLAEYVLADTARCYMDELNVCVWREKVRECLRMARAYEQDHDAERRRKMAPYYHQRALRFRVGYRRAIASARQEMSAPLKQAAE